MISMRPKQKGSSLFFKLLVSFILISLLPLSFNFFSYAFFRTNLQEELIKNNSLNTNTTVKHYEELITIIKNFEFAQYSSAAISALGANTNDIDYLAVHQIQADLANYLANASLHVEDMIILLNTLEYAIDKSGSSPMQDMFSKYYNSDKYNYDFWKREASVINGFKAYPSAEFSFQSTNSQRIGNFMPILYGDFNRRGIAILTLLDNERMYNSYYSQTDGSRFFILDDKNNLLFASDPNSAKTTNFPDMTQSKGYVKIGTDYLFYQKGANSGFTYVNIIPTSHISSQITKLNWILVSVLSLSLLLSVAISIYVSVRLNNPIRKIIESIRELNFSVPPQSQIKEFNVITDKISDLVQANLVIHQDLNRQNSLLKYYAYTNKLKNIKTNLNEGNIPLNIDKPFMLIGFQLLFTSQLTKEMNIEQNKAANFFKEFINADLVSSFPESLTFQTEHDIILSLIFMDTDNRQKIMEHVQHWKQVFDLDREYCLVTITVSEKYTHTSNFPNAYKHILQLLDHRRPGGVTQIITEADSHNRPHFDSDDDHVFYANLEMGNVSELVQIVKRKLNAMDRKNATLGQMHKYSADVIRKVYKAAGKEISDLRAAGSDNKQMSLYELVRECYTVEQLEQFFEQFLQAEVSQIRQKKEETDPIIDFVTEYISSHIGDDISLDLLADKLNITGAYLSTYFKEKKKVNFSEYINNLRMKKAQELLETTDLKVQDIASLVGYYSVNAFIRTFKKNTGVPPGEFRKVKISD